VSLENHWPGVQGVNNEAHRSSQSRTEKIKVKK
jgi:hypothetical protein